jgi:transcription antitermination factor NusG
VYVESPASVKGWETWEAALRAEPPEAIPDNLPGVWWVAHTRPRNEKALTLELRARDVFSYLPLSLRTTRSKATGRLSRSIVPVFPGYVFFNGDDKQRQLALQTNRIANVIPVAGQAQLVGELRQVQRVIITQTEFEWEPAIEIGQWARVVAGPLRGTEGVVCRRMSRMRLALNVRLLSQSVLVEVARDMLEPIDAPSYAT